MSKESTTFAHEDLIHDNQVHVSELPQKTQDLIAKIKTLTDPDAQDAMDQKIYGQIEDYLEAKIANQKAEKVKEKVTAHKEKKAAATIDVSKADTATLAQTKTPAQTKAKPDEPAPPAKSALGFLFGRK